MKNIPDPSHRGIDRLLQLMRDLRDPEQGCPWDIEQTFQTIAPYTIEEAYEVADAIENGSMDDVKDELGDLLLQVVFHAQMAQDGGIFDFNDVAQAVTDKMVRRHPHIYAAADITTADQQEVSWEAIKAEERASKGLSGRSSLMDDVTVGLPASTRAVKLQKRAAKVGFDWDHLDPVVEKIREELDEVLAECPENPAEANEEQRDRLEDEFGDLLFAVANLGRHLRIDPEKALRRTNAKFERRFRFVEQAFSERNADLKSASLEEMDREWDRAKALENGQI
ncbi:nucleoside triphosphate pyrophosphohydrolase [Kiloniella sp. b19]|uniref:nucleoside triphosphate pyrophosphohydrolase n=1 Tax=Kiloniella sp. GXU_MW_B19 TaxID=3141326 RepID=UPI0031D0C74D